MKIFISWSGDRSREVAKALSEWLPRVIQALQPYFSPEIEKGSKWSTEVDQALEGTAFGIICLTRENLRSEWVHYEAGALSKTGDARIWTLLVDVDHADVRQPLGRFQHTKAEAEDIRKMLHAINTRLSVSGGTPLPERMLDEIFDDAWPRLRAALDRALTLSGEESNRITSDGGRGDREILEEILEHVRVQARRIDALEAERGQTRAKVRRPATSRIIRSGELTFHQGVSEELAATYVKALNARFAPDVLILTPLLPTGFAGGVRLEFTLGLPRNAVAQSIFDVAEAYGVPLTVTWNHDETTGSGSHM